MVGNFHNIRTDFNKPIDQFQKEFLNDEFRDYYPEMYTGKVVSNQDPEKLGRCRVRVYNIFDDTIPDGDIPWAIPDMTFLGSKVGNFIVPPIGAIVNVYFDKGDIYTPRYTTKAVDKSNLPKQRLKNYPNNIVFHETDNGDYFTLDRTTGETIINHRTGSSIKINIDGSVTVNSSLQVDINAKIVNIKGDEKVPIGGGVVVPNPSGGSMNCLPICPMLGLVHQGYKAINT